MGNIGAYLDSVNIFVSIYEKRIEIINVGNRRILILHMIFSGFFMKKNDRKFKPCNEPHTFTEYMGISAEIAGGSPGSIGKYFIDSVGSKTVLISKKFQIGSFETGTISDKKTSLTGVLVFILQQMSHFTVQEESSGINLNGHCTLGILKSVHNQVK